MQPFPDKFDPRRWFGPKARLYGEPDAFQQLIGDRLREDLGARAHVAPTRGKDGSIDIWLDHAPQSVETYWALPFPIVVECKYHDPHARYVQTNLLRAWEGVRKKLRQQAEQGWSGLFTPWKTVRGYAYCISVHLTNQRVRQDLVDRIRQFFFSELPPAQRPPRLEAVGVLDWSDLRGWLDSGLNVPDWWLGIELPTIVPHRAFIETLSGFRRYLLPSQLPFVSPPSDVAYHPNNVFNLVEQRASTQGVLLVGQGGIGKTRTAIEVAVRADAAGFRVLHIRPGEPGVTVEQLAAAIACRRGPTLLVFDYLDQMTRLDLTSLRQQLLPEAGSSGVTLALLATARGALTGFEEVEVARLFVPIYLDPTPAQLQRIAVTIQTRIAARATAILGSERVRTLCGLRPIIGMFIARELERRAEAGLLTPTTLSGLREGDLLGWLRARLADDGLTLPRAKGLASLLPPDPDCRLVASAAVFAAAPQDLQSLTRTAAAVLELESAQLAQDANKLVLALINLGWLEAEGDQWGPAHDVVADEVIEQVLCVRPSGLLRDAAFQTLLAPAFASARTLGRIAVALRRLLEPSPVPAAFKENLQEAATAWVTRSAPKLAETLISAEPDEAGYALGALISHPPLSVAAHGHWNVLVEPWLSQHGRRREARHLLHRALRGRASNVAPYGRELLSHSFGWLQEHGSEPEASFVLSGVLDQQDLGDMAATAVESGLRWLRQNGRMTQAQFVLRSLLRRTDLDTMETDITSVAFDWLDLYHSYFGASFVLGPLLGRPDLGDRSPAAIDLACGWLTSATASNPQGSPPGAAHHTTPEASFVLGPLLGRPDLGDRSPVAIDLACGWLAAHRTTPEASFVLGPLLGRPDLGDRTELSINLALGWLANNVTAPAAELVLQRLYRSSLPPPARKQLSSLTLARLEALIETPEASFLLRHSLKAFAAFPPNDRARLVTSAVTWLNLHARHPDLDFVANALLRRREVEDGDWRRAADHLIAWLRESPNEGSLEYAANSLSLRPHLLSDDERPLLSVAQAQTIDVDSVPSATTAAGHLRAKLARFASGAEPTLNPTILADGLCEANRLVEEGHIVRAGFLLVPLLLALHRGDSPLVSEVGGLARRITFDDRLRSDQYVALIRYSRQLLAASPLPRAAEELLEQLGLSPHGLLRMARATGEPPPAVLRLKGAAALVESFLSARRVAQASYYLAPLLLLAAKSDSEEIKDEVYGLTRRLITDATAEPDAFADFVQTCCWLFDVGSWPQGELVLHDLGFEVARLFGLARSRTSVPDPTPLIEKVPVVEDLLDSNEVTLASYYIAPLLPLVHANCDTTTQEKLRDLAKRFMTHPFLRPESRDGFSRLCSKLVEIGAWTDPDVAAEALDSIGLGFTELRGLALNTSAIPGQDQLAAAITTANACISRQDHRLAGRWLAPLLPLMARVGFPDLASQVYRMVRVMTGDAAVEPRVRDGFKRACQELLDRGAWIKREVGEQVLEELGIAAPGLERLALDKSAVLERAQLEQALIRAEQLLEASSPGSARHILIRLLPLTARFGETKLQAQTDALIITLLKHPKVGTQFQRSFARSCRELLEADAWPDRETGRRRLHGLGIDV